MDDLLTRARMLSPNYLYGKLCHELADELENKAGSVAGLVEYAQSLERKVADLERRNGALSTELLRLRNEFQ